MVQMDEYYYGQLRSSHFYSTNDKTRYSILTHLHFVQIK